jgi:hypothetical protein
MTVVDTGALTCEAKGEHPPIESKPKPERHFGNIQAC